MSDPQKNRDRALAFLGSLSASLLIAIVVLFKLPNSPIGDPQGNGVKDAAIARLLSGIARVFDSHPDADVSRVLAPNLHKVVFRGVEVSSSACGMRERDYELPKPDGLVRVVMLGDSYVFGLGSRAEDRFGAVLEQELRERAGWDNKRQIEVLHIGIGSWNTKAECAYLLRHLTPLDPDLVVQVFISNDLDDNIGARGFGTRSNFDPGHPERGNARIYQGFSPQVHGVPGNSPILMGLDHESRSRFAEAAGWVARLAGALEDRDCPFVFFSTMGGGYGLVVGDQFGPAVGGVDRILFTDTEFMQNMRYRISETDGHWNVAGNRRVAELVYGCIVERDLLPELELEPWAEAAATYAELHEGAVARMETDRRPSRARRTELLEPNQIYGGIFPDQSVGPYAAVFLSPEGRGTLELTGSYLPRREMNGSAVHVFIDEVEVHTAAMVAGEPFRWAIDVPSELAAREHVAVRLVSEDWALEGPHLRDCISLKLEELAFLE